MVSVDAPDELLLTVEESLEDRFLNDDDPWKNDGASSGPRTLPTLILSRDEPRLKELGR